MPDPHEVFAEEQQRKIERRAARSLSAFERILSEARPDQGIIVMNVNLVRRDRGFLLVIKGVCGIENFVIFRDVFSIADFVEIAVEALRTGKWRPEKPPPWRSKPF